MNIVFGTPGKNLQVAAITGICPKLDFSLKLTVICPKLEFLSQLTEMSRYKKLEMDE